MDMFEYQQLAMRTKDKDLNPTEQAVLGCLGLAGESGEFIDLFKKQIFHKKEVSPDDMKKELGDILWYVALICDSMGWDLNAIADINVEKLRKRYPEGFSYEKANNRED